MDLCGLGECTISKCQLASLPKDREEHPILEQRASENFRTIGNFCSAAESTLTLQGPASLAALEVQSVAFTQCCKAASYMSEMYRNVRLQQICGCRLLVRLFELGANKLHHLPEPCKHVSCCVKCGYTRLFSAKIVKV